MWQDNYGGSSSQQSYYRQPQTSQAVPLQFYQPQPGQDGYYGGSRPSLEGNAIPQGSISTQPVQSYGGNIQPAGGWLSAFGTGGIEGEPPLLEGTYAASPLPCPLSSPCLLELGINFSHIRSKSLAVLNPFERIDARIMDDADLAGPLIFFLCFATFLLFVRVLSVLICLTYLISVLSYPVRKAPVQLHLWHCPLGFRVDSHPAELNGRTGDRRIPSDVGPRILPSAHRWCWRTFCCRDTGVRVPRFRQSFVLTHESSGLLGYLVSFLSVIWSTYSASGIFVTVLRMSDQRLLVAYPVALFYGCFALFSVFSVHITGK